MCVLLARLFNRAGQTCDFPTIGQESFDVQYIFLGETTKQAAAASENFVLCNARRISLMI